MDKYTRACFFPPFLVSCSALWDVTSSGSWGGLVHSGELITEMVGGQCDAKWEEGFSAETGCQQSQEGI